MVIEYHDFNRRILGAGFERSDPVRVLRIDQHQPRDLRDIDIFEFGHVQIVHGKKIPDGLLASARQHQLGIRKKLARGNHRGKTVEIRVTMRGYDIHERILTGSRYMRNAGFFVQESDGRIHICQIYQPRSEASTL